LGQKVKVKVTAGGDITTDGSPSSFISNAQYLMHTAAG